MAWCCRSHARTDNFLLLAHLTIWLAGCWDSHFTCISIPNGIQCHSNNNRMQIITINRHFVLNSFDFTRNRNSFIRNDESVDLQMHRCTDAHTYITKQITAKPRFYKWLFMMKLLHKIQCEEFIERVDLTIIKMRIFICSDEYSARIARLMHQSMPVGDQRNLALLSWAMDCSHISAFMTHIFEYFVLNINLDYFRSRKHITVDVF